MEKIKEAAKPVTRDFKETIRNRVQRDRKFCKELLRQGQINRVHNAIDRDGRMETPNSSSDCWHPKPSS